MDEENKYWGQNTIKPIYNLLAKFGLFEKTNDMMPAYYIPYWTNSGSYLRDLYNDYGAFGVIWGPFLLGFLSAYFWLQFYYYYTDYFTALNSPDLLIISCQEVGVELYSFELY